MTPNQPIKLYLVIGEKGSCSDWTTWIVCAYVDRESAEEHCKRAEAERKEEIKHNDEDETYFVNKDTLKYDHQTLISDLGTVDYDEKHYSVKECNLFQHLDQYLEINNL